jgi:hypothetical protein
MDSLNGARDGLNGKLGCQKRPVESVSGIGNCGEPRHTRRPNPDLE